MRLERDRCAVNGPNADFRHLTVSIIGNAGAISARHVVRQLAQ
jgi:hypothetical protein